MKFSSLIKGAAAVATFTAIAFGSTYATSLVVPQTTICVKISNDYSNKIKSMSIAPYYNDKALGAEIATSSENGTCTTVSRDWLMGAAQPGTSFFVTGKDKNNFTYLLESRDLAMFKDIKNLKDKARIVLNYDVKGTVIPNTTLLIGSVTSELHIYDAGGVESVKQPQKGIYRSDLKDIDALNAMRQIGATKYTKIADFKGKSNVTREQAAKFFVAAWQATHVGQTIKENGNVSCKFSDDNKIDATLLESARSACKLGLMRGTQGAFNPQDNLTLAEAATILVRMQYGAQKETYSPWYHAYFDKSYDVDLFDGFAYNPHILDGTLTISREMIGFMIRRLLQINNIQLITYPTI